MAEETKKSKGTTPAGRNRTRTTGSSVRAGGRPAAPGTFRREGSAAPANRRTAKPGTARPGGQGLRERKPAVPEGLVSRRIALRILCKVTEEGAFASLALDAALRDSGLSGADRRLVSRLVYDTLDRLIYLDWALDQVMARPDTEIRLRNILRLGACQILLEDRIPDSAATNLCVELCAEQGMSGLKGVCNGILRNLVRQKEQLTLPSPEEDPVKAASIRLSVPEWLARKVQEDYGEEAENILSWRNREEGWMLRPNMTRLTDEEFEQLLDKKVWKKEKTDLPHAWRVTGAMEIARDADYLQGNFSIQSGGSMLACLAMDVKRGQRVLDCCAAPGGKSCYLAELMNGTGRVQSWDLHEHRVKLIEAQMRRLGLENIRPMARDALKIREELYGTMDAVLLDAPCTGTGFLAEKPDLKLRLTEQGFRELTELQGRLLDTVCQYVRPGGVLVYATCSILRDENEAQAEAFLQLHPEFEEAEMPRTIPEKYRKLRTRGIQLREDRDGLEGFYLIRMKRKEETGTL